MNGLEYSTEALESKGLFYNKKITVYVEGKDDPLFWQELFNIAEVEAHIEDVGGKEELKKYIDKIKNEDAKFIVATDNDNQEFMEGQSSHERIIRTFGYSIENTIYKNTKNIESTISRICRTQLDLSTDFNGWIENFSNDVLDLIIYDIANNKYNKGISIFGDSCFRFLKGQKSFSICSNKIADFINSISHKFSNKEIETVRKMVNQSEKDLWFLIKGHFITNSLLNLVKSLLKKHSGTSKSMTPDFLYSITLDCKENWQNRIDICSVVDKIKTMNVSV